MRAATLGTGLCAIARSCWKRSPKLLPAASPRGDPPLLSQRQCDGGRGSRQCELLQHPIFPAAGSVAARKPQICRARELNAADFLRPHGHHVRYVPIVSGPLFGRRLRRALTRMHPSALSLDSWSLEDAGALPSQLLKWLATTLQEVECLGRCPLCLAKPASPRSPR